MSPSSESVSVLGVGVGTPSLLLPAAEVAAAWSIGGGKGTLGVCDSDEDTLTLAWRAATDALSAAGLEAGEVSGLWWGTARPPFAEGPSHAFLAASLGIDPAAGGALFAGSPHAGMDALLGAWDSVSAGHSSVALVIASDALLSGLGTSSESATGAGAAALVLGPPSAAAPARLLGRATRSMPVVDRYRPDGDCATGDPYDARLFREEIYLPLLSSVGAAVGASNGAASPPATWAVSDPDGKLGSALAKRLGAPLASAAVQSTLGDTGSAAALLGLIEAAAEESDETRCVGVIGYGGGRASAVTVELSGPLPGASRVESHLSRASKVNYTKAIRARGQLEPMADPIPMGLPPAGAAFARGNIEMLGLQGALCAKCGTISTPPSIHPTCTGCGGSDLSTVKLARRGTIVTFVVNQTMPPPFAAPLPLLVVELEDGAQVMVQGSPVDAAEMAVGDTVVLSLRRYALERGIPVYGYKASREIQGDPHVAGATGLGSARA